MPRRPTLPAGLRRDVLVEAGHRCAIPTCHGQLVEIAHIEPWKPDGSNDVFENLIALCPTCHARYDKHEIDRPAMRRYKANLSIVNSRYNDFERRIFELFGEQPQAAWVDLQAADVSVLYAVRDGLLADAGPSPGQLIQAGQAVLTPRRYLLTGKGRSFVQRWFGGQALDE